MSFFALPVGSTRTHCCHVCQLGLAVSVVTSGVSPAQYGIIDGASPGTIHHTGFSITEVFGKSPIVRAAGGAPVTSKPLTSCWSVARS